MLEAVEPWRSVILILTFNLLSLKVFYFVASKFAPILNPAPLLVSAPGLGCPCSRLLLSGIEALVDPRSMII